MKVKFTFSSEEEIVLPIHYNYILQSFIYNCMDRVFSTFLHDKGIVYDGKNFKLFTFSQIFGRRRILKKDKKIVFKPPIHFYFSCAFKDLLNSYVLNVLEKEELNLGGNKVFLQSVEAIEEMIEKTPIVIKTLSPITVHRTSKEGRTIYYNPYQEEFYELIKKNIQRKAKAFGVPFEYFSLEPVEGAKFAKVVTYYKNNFVIEAWKGKFIMRANPKLAKLVLEAGLGDRNSQGFGMVVKDIVKG